MKKIAKCEYCDEEFCENDNDKTGNEYLCRCVKHEITHLLLKEKFEENVSMAISIMDRRYESRTECFNCDVIPIIHKVNGNIIYRLAYTGTIEINKSKRVGINIKTFYHKKKDAPSAENIIKEIEQFYELKINKCYEGVFNFDDRFYTYVMDYTLNGESMKSVFSELKGKKIKITVVD